MATKVESYKSDSGRLFLTEEAAVRHDAMERIIEAVPELALIRLRIEGNLDAIAQATAPLVSLKAKNHPEAQPKTTLRPSDKPRWNACQPLQEVEFTTVRAPLSGRISDRQIDACNLVSAGDAGGTLLTTINALDPIYFTFQGSEALFLKTKREGGDKSAAIEVRLQDEGDYRWKGQLDFTDNGLDPRSGTIRARGRFANPEMFLTPGMFGNMRLSSGAKERALLVPDAAIQTDQARKTLLVVGKDGQVAAREVKLGPVVDGLRVVRGGVTPTDRVVIVGTQLAQPGTKVQTRVGKIAPVAATAAPPSTALVGEATFAR